MCSTSATWALEIQRCSVSSQIACGYVIGVQAVSPMAAIAARILRSILAVMEKHTAARRQAATAAAA